MSPLSPGARVSSTENLIPPEDTAPSAVEPLLRPHPLITTESDDSRAVPLLTLPPLSTEPTVPTSTGSESGARSFPDIELHCRRTHLCPQTLAHRRCSCINMHRAGSRDSVCSVVGGRGGAAGAGGALGATAGLSCSRDKIVRQHSQPETCSSCHQPRSAASLRQLHYAQPEPGRSSEFAEIACDSLRINGAIRQFRHVSEDGVLLL